MARKRHTWFFPHTSIFYPWIVASRLWNPWEWKAQTPRVLKPRPVSDSCLCSWAHLSLCFAYFRQKGQLSVLKKLDIFPASPVSQNFLIYIFPGMLLLLVDSPDYLCSPSLLPSTCSLQPHSQYDDNSTYYNRLMRFFEGFWWFFYSLGLLYIYF